MDFTPAGIHSPKSPETDTDTETPLQTHLSKALSLTTNGSLKPHHHHHPSPPPQQMVLVSYKECLKNHACTLGGLALDGCGEFMPPPTRHAASPVSPISLKCAACGCHRNFHRRECISASPSIMAPQPPPQIQWTSSASPGGSTSSPSPSHSSPPASPSPQSFYSSAPHVLLALSTGQSVPPPLDEAHCQNPIFTPVSLHPSGRKRARTKFTAEQKEKMSSFAEKLGWKMARGPEEKLLAQFCLEIGVKRDVFKVWMHNNKARRERDRGNNGNGNGNTTSRPIIYDFNSNIGNSDSGHDFEGRVITSDNNVFNTNSNTYDRFQIESKVHVLRCTEGSSPSC